MQTLCLHQGLRSFQRYLGASLKEKTFYPDTLAGSQVLPLAAARSSTSPTSIHFITAPFHNQQQHGLLRGVGGAQTRITIITPGRMSGNFPEISSQILSAGVTKCTTAELQSPVTAQLKHFLYTFSCSCAPPIFWGFSQQVIPGRGMNGLGPCSHLSSCKLMRNPDP